MVADRVVLASSNKGKLRELKKILHQENVELLQQSAFGITDAEETGVELRRKCNYQGKACLRDDRASKYC